jgi:hypothetical protein
MRRKTLIISLVGGHGGGLCRPGVRALIPWKRRSTQQKPMSLLTGFNFVEVNKAKLIYTFT